MNNQHPTPNRELNAILNELVTSVQAILAENFVSAYLQGSLATGDWDSHSDVDFLIVIGQELSKAELAALQAMHARIYALDSLWAQHLDGSYFPKDLLRHNDPTRQELFYLDNGHRELVKSNHDNELVVRWVVRERGITLAGPEAKELIDSVAAEDLRQEVLATMHGWADDIFAERYQINNRWAQPFAVLTYCRMLHTLQTGGIESKPAGAAWAKSALDSRWMGLIQRAWAERPHPALKAQQKADPDDVKMTLDFIRYTLTISSQYPHP